MCRLFHVYLSRPCGLASVQQPNFPSFSLRNPVLPLLLWSPLVASDLGSATLRTSNLAWVAYPYPAPTSLTPWSLQVGFGSATLLASIFVGCVTLPGPTSTLFIWCGLASVPQPSLAVSLGWVTLSCPYSPHSLLVSVQQANFHEIGCVTLSSPYLSLSLPLFTPLPRLLPGHENARPPPVQFALHSFRHSLRFFSPFRLIFIFGYSSRFPMVDHPQNPEKKTAETAIEMRRWNEITEKRTFMVV